MTDPPVVGDVGPRGRASLRRAAARDQPGRVPRDRRARSSASSSPSSSEMLRTLVALYLRRADRVVAIGETMKRRLEEKGAPAERVVVIPNWVDTTELTPQPRSNEWSEAHGLEGRFVVMHSGNIGHAQDLDTLVRAATFLRDLDGPADRRDRLRRTARRGHAARPAARGDADGEVLRLPAARATAALARSGDLHYVGLARGLAGFVVPSRRLRDPRRRPAGARLRGCERARSSGSSRMSAAGSCCRPRAPSSWPA